MGDTCTPWSRLSSHLNVFHDVGKAGRAAEGNHDRVAAPADQHLQVLARLPEDLNVRQAEEVQGSPESNVDLCFVSLQEARSYALLVPLRHTAATQR